MHIHDLSQYRDQLRIDQLIWFFWIRSFDIHSRKYINTYTYIYIYIAPAAFAYWRTSVLDLCTNTLPPRIHSNPIAFFSRSLQTHLVEPAKSTHQDYKLHEFNSIVILYLIVLFFPGLRLSMAPAMKYIRPPISAWKPPPPIDNQWTECFFLF